MMGLIRIASLATVLAASVSSAQSTQGLPIHCVLSNPTSCLDISALWWSPEFTKAVTRFAGNERASYFRHDKTLSSQALFGLRGPPESRISLPGGFYLFAACPAHECGGQAAAMVLDEHGKIRGIGFSSFHCAPRCDFDHRYLDFYVRRGPSAETIASELSTWGRADHIHSLIQNPQADDEIEHRTSAHLLP